MEAAERHTLPAASISIATFVLDCFNIYGREKINRFVGKSFSYIDEQRCLSQEKIYLYFLIARQTAQMARQSVINAAFFHHTVKAHTS